MALQTRFAIGALVTLLGTGVAQAGDSSRLTPADVIAARAAVAAPSSGPVKMPPAPVSVRPALAEAARSPSPVVANPAHEGPAPAIADLVVKHAHDNGVPVGLANAVINIESRFNPKARNRGAFGLMQINAGTARNAGFVGNADGLLSPDTNLQYGMKVLAEAYRASGGDVCRTLAYYQSGRPVRHFSRAQRAYCSKARSYMAHA